MYNTALSVFLLYNGPGEVAIETPNRPEGPARILAVDDQPTNLKVLHRMLTEQGYDVTCAADGLEALDHLSRDPLPDLVLMDILMPGLNGYEVCRRVRGEARTRLLPVVLLTSLTESRERIEGLEAGADDFISKPFLRDELLARVRSLLRQKFLVDELDNAENVILSLAVAVEARDECTEGHIERVSQQCVRLATRLGLGADDVDALSKGGVLHDIGKLRVPDRILNKPGSLTPDEFEIMKLHTVWGERICRPLRSVRRVLPIIRHHHERPDGTGYPDGLKGEEIPVLARILSVVDVFDALISDRPYRSRMTVDQALAILHQNAARGWLFPDIVAEMERMIQDEGAPDVPPMSHDPTR